MPAMCSLIRDSLRGAVHADLNGVWNIAHMTCMGLSRAAAGAGGSRPSAAERIRFRLQWIGLCLFLGVAAGMAQPVVSEDAVRPSSLVEEHFVALDSGFREVASARVLGSVELLSTDRHFSKALDEYLGVHSFFRTNSKGVVINEVIRGQRPERVYRSIAKQQWYRSLRSARESYRGATVDRHGDTYLLWAEPIVVSTGGGATRYGGAVGAKVSLKGCILDIAERSAAPFELWVDGRPFYSHRWTDGVEADTVPVAVPGIDGVVVVEARSAADMSLALMTGVAPDDSGKQNAVECDTAVMPVQKAIDEEQPRASVFPTGRVTAFLLLSWFFVGMLRTHARRQRILREVYRDAIP